MAATVNGTTTTTSAYSPEYLAESRTVLLTAFYSIPIPLEILSTAFRLWVKLRVRGGWLAFDDYLIIWATVRTESQPKPTFDLITLAIEKRNEIFRVA